MAATTTPQRLTIAESHKNCKGLGIAATLHCKATATRPTRHSAHKERVRGERKCESRRTTRTRASPMFLLLAFAIAHAHAEHRGRARRLAPRAITPVASAAPAFTGIFAPPSALAVAVLLAVALCVRSRRPPSPEAVAEVDPDPAEKGTHPPGSSVPGFETPRAAGAPVDGEAAANGGDEGRVRGSVAIRERSSFNSDDGGSVGGSSVSSSKVESFTDRAVAGCVVDVLGGREEEGA